MVAERCVYFRWKKVIFFGDITSDNVGMSNIKLCVKHSHRKSKVSYDRLVRVGLIGL